MLILRCSIGLIQLGDHRVRQAQMALTGKLSGQGPVSWPKWIFYVTFLRLWGGAWFWMDGKNACILACVRVWESLEEPVHFIRFLNRVSCTLIMQSLYTGCPSKHSTPTRNPARTLRSPGSYCVILWHASVPPHKLWSLVLQGRRQCVRVMSVAQAYQMGAKENVVQTCVWGCACTSLQET